MFRELNGNRILLISLLGLAAMLISGALILSKGLGAAPSISTHTVGLLEITSASAAKPPTIPQAAVEAAAREAAAIQLARAQATSAESGKAYASVAGRPVAADDLDLVQSTYSPSVSAVVSQSGSRFTTGQPFDAWSIVFQRTGVAVPEWGLTDGVLESIVIIDDTTGEIRSSGVRLVNPHATTRKPPAP